MRALDLSSEEKAIRRALASVARKARAAGAQPGLYFHCHGTMHIIDLSRGEPSPESALGSMSLANVCGVTDCGDW